MSKPNRVENVRLTVMAPDTGIIYGRDPETGERDASQPIEGRYLVVQLNHTDTEPNENGHFDVFDGHDRDSVNAGTFLSRRTFMSDRPLQYLSKDGMVDINGRHARNSVAVFYTEDQYQRMLGACNSNDMRYDLTDYYLDDPESYDMRPWVFDPENTSGSAFNIVADLKTTPDGLDFIVDTDSPMHEDGPVDLIKQSDAIGFPDSHNDAGYFLGYISQLPSSNTSSADGSWQRLNDCDLSYLTDGSDLSLIEAYTMPHPNDFTKGSIRLYVSDGEDIFAIQHDRRYCGGYAGDVDLDYVNSKYSWISNTSVAKVDAIESSLRDHYLTGTDSDRLDAKTVDSISSELGAIMTVSLRNAYYGSEVDITDSFSADTLDELVEKRRSHTFSDNGVSYIDSGRVFTVDEQYDSILDIAVAQDMAPDADGNKTVHKLPMSIAEKMCEGTSFEPKALLTIDGDEESTSRFRLYATNPHIKESSLLVIDQTPYLPDGEPAPKMDMSEVSCTNRSLSRKFWPIVYGCDENIGKTSGFTDGYTFGYTSDELRDGMRFGGSIGSISPIEQHHIECAQLGEQMETVAKDHGFDYLSKNAFAESSLPEDENAPALPFIPHAYDGPNELKTLFNRQLAVATLRDDYSTLPEYEHLYPKLVSELDIDDPNVEVLGATVDVYNSNQSCMDLYFTSKTLSNSEDVATPCVYVMQHTVDLRDDAKRPSCRVLRYNAEELSGSQGRDFVSLFANSWGNIDSVSGYELGYSSKELENGLRFNGQVKIAEELTDTVPITPAHVQIAKLGESIDAFYEKHDLLTKMRGNKLSAVYELNDMSCAADYGKEASASRRAMEARLTASAAEISAKSEAETEEGVRYE